MDNTNITGNLTRLRQRYGDTILTLFAAEVVRRGIRSLKKQPAEDQAAQQLRDLAKDLDAANWNIIRSVIKRCL